MVKNRNTSLITNLILAGFLYSSFANLGKPINQNYEDNPTSLETTVESEKSWDNFLFEQKSKNPEGRIEYEGGMKIKFLDDGREIKIPSWINLGVEKPNQCSGYARRLASKLGYRLNQAEDAWNLHKVNPSMDYLSDNLKTGDIITLYNPKSKYKRRERLATHAATYLGEDNDGKLYFAEQRGSSTRISTIEDFLKKGMKPVKIIKTEKID